MTKLKERNTPEISVLMPIYNAGADLRLAVESIIHQIFKDWELLIIDDGSTDNAIQTISDINDSRIHIISDGVNKGLAARLNEAIDLAKGTYFARMDQDDVSFPDRLSKQLALLNSDPALDLVASSAIAISDENLVIGLMPSPAEHEVICSKPWKGFYLIHPTWMGKSEWFRHNKYRVPGPYFCEDQELLIRTHMTSKFAAVNDYLLAYRVRAKRNLPRVVKTRWTLLLIQINYFKNENKPFYAVKSRLNFCAIILRDLWWNFRQVSKYFKSEEIKLDEKTAAIWREILQGKKL